MTTKRSLAGRAVLAVAVLALAGCGAQPFPNTEARTPVPPAVAPTGATAKARLLAAVQSATAARTARLSLTMSITGAGSGGTVTATGSGLIDLAGHRLSMTVDEQNDEDDLTLQMRFVDGTMYVNIGDGWTSLPLAEAQTDTPMPNSYIDYLQGLSNDAHVEGREVVRGDETIRYGATVDLSSAFKYARSAAQKTELGHALSTLGSLKIPTTAWVDAQGRLRKVRMKIDLSALVRQLGAPAGSHPMIDETFELYDFGVPVSVAAPGGAVSAVTAAQDSATKSDLRNGLTAEKTYYTDDETYTADSGVLKQIEPSLGWGGKLTVAVGAASGQRDQVVCLAERSASGVTFALADVASGPAAGTFYGKAGCPKVVTEGNVSTLGSSW